MSRYRLPNRQASLTVAVEWRPDVGSPDHKIVITYQLDEHYQIKGAFVAGMRIEVGMNALANDACILFSRCLQHGDSLNELAHTMIRNEGLNERGEKIEWPASMIGAIAKRAVEEQRKIDEERGNSGDHRPGA